MYEEQEMANGSSRRIILQSGALPVAGDRVVLVTARKSGQWIIPKGFVDRGLSPAESAAKEAFEEAGVRGTVRDSEIGSYSYFRSGSMYFVRIFPLIVDSILDEWEEMHARERRLVSVEEAIRMIRQEELRAIVAGYFGHLQV